LEKNRERSAPLPRVEVKRPGEDVACRLRWRKFVALKLGGLALFTGQKRDKRTQHFASAPEPFARDLDDRMRPTGFAHLAKHKSGFPAPADQRRPASIRSEGVPKRQCPHRDAGVARGDRDQVARCRSGSLARATA
jgi:hypothetical protein